MGVATSCQYFISSEEPVPEPGTQVTANENCKGIYSPSKVAEFAPELKPPNTYKIAPENKSPNSHKTVYRPARESLKTLRKKDDRADRKFADERWKKAKEEWQATVIADLEAQAAAKEPERYSSDERTLALQAIRAEEEERKRAGTLMLGSDKSRVVPPKDLSPIPEFAEVPPQPEDLSPEELPCAFQADVDKHESTTDLEERQEPQQPEAAQEGRPQLAEEPQFAEAAQEGKPQLAEEADDRKTLLETFLSKNGFDGVSNKRRRTLQPSIYPLHLAAEKGDATLVTLLLEAGADASQKDSSGRTPADIAKKRNRNGSHDEVFRLLSFRNE